MTDFTKQVFSQEPIIKSLMDIDFYKLTMGQFIFKNYPGTRAKFSLINRNADIPLAKIINEFELRAELDHVRTLRFTKSELSYLRGIDTYGPNLFKEDYLSFLARFQMPEYDLQVVGDQFQLDFDDTWSSSSPWETIAMAIVSELYFRTQLREMSKLDIKVTYANATIKLYNKLKVIKQQAPGALITDFGQRRRHSFEWQKFAIQMAQEVLGDTFTGTSNVWMAQEMNLTPIGTNAHELPMVVTALAPDDTKRLAQYKVLREWESMYDKGLQIVLPDTYGSKQFWDGMPEQQAKNVAQNWRGMRQDSGQMLDESDLYYQWASKNGVSEEQMKSKVCIFSDGLDYESIIREHNGHKEYLTTPFGWGTMLTNDFVGCSPSNSPLFKPFSIVCKVTEANGKPAVKLSNNPNKATGPKDEVEKYKRIFGVEGFTDQEVKV